MRRSTLLALALLLSTAPISLAQTAADAGQAGCGNSYTIARGDTLGGIARRCNISLSALRSANPGAQPRRLRIGAQLSLPGGESQGDASAEDAAAGGGTTYTIRAGDTLGAIAKRNNISLRELMNANSGIQPKRLRVGQVIQMPGGAGSTVASGTEAAGAPSGSAGATPEPGYGAGSSSAEGGAGAGSPSVPSGGETGYGTGSNSASEAGAAGTGTAAGSAATGDRSATTGSPRPTPPQAGTGATPPQSGTGANPPQTGTGLNLSPAAGPVGTPVELRAEGFQPGERVSLRIGAGQQAPAEFASVEADPQGRIGVRVAVPQGAQPSQRLTFAAVGANGTERSNTFLVSGGAQQPATTGRSPSPSPNGGPTTEPQSTEPQSTPEQRSPGR